MKNKKIIYVVVAVVIILGSATVYFWDRFKGLQNQIEIGEEQGKEKVIEESLVIPNTQKISGTDGRIVNEGAYQTPLVPKNNGEKVIVAQAIFTVKNSYDAAVVEAQKWSADAKLVFIKSLGAVTIEGKSSQWQAVFGSEDLKKGYEIIIQADKVVSQKEVVSGSFGFDLPKNWFDSDGAIKSLQNLPQFSAATISAISFFYNSDAQQWRYGLATSLGNTSIPVK